MTTLAAWRPATAYAKGATVRPNAAQSSAPVPILNGGFNSGDTAWTKDTGWAINTGDTYEGTYKAEFTGTGSGRIKTSGTYPATAGQVITATVKAKVSDEADGATALLLWYDSSNVLISTSTGLESSVETGVWMQLEVAGVAPDAAAFVTFAVEATRTVGTRVLIDDARWTYSAPIEARRTAYRAVQDAAGVSGVTEPTWPTTLGARVNDGTVIWEAVEVSWIEWTAQPIIESGTTEPVWPTTVGAFVRDGTANWECVSRRVEDENCPNTKTVCIISSKVFAADKDIVRFCATAMPLDWSSERDAGYLPTGLQQANGNDMAVLYPYRSNLGCWNANGFQLWQVDPDPTQMALLDQMDGIGSTHPLAACAVGNDLYFLGNAGVRSVGIASAAQNMQAGDVGMPIDVLVQAATVQAAIDGRKALSTYWPGMGQYWLAFGDDGTTAGAGGALRLICAPPSGVVGNAYSYTFSATGGTAPYAFDVYAGTLPTGLTLDTETGELAGVPTAAGSFSFTIRVTDALGVEAFCSWSGPVADEVEIESYSLLITGEYKGGAGNPKWCVGDAVAAPTFVGIDQSTGADISAAVGTYRPNVGWSVVDNNEARYAETLDGTWATGSVTTGTLKHHSNGPGGALVAHSSGGSMLYDDYAAEGIYSSFDPSATYSNGDNFPTIDSDNMDSFWSTTNYWWANHDRTLLRADTVQGPYVAVRDGFKNTAEGLDNNGAVVVGFPCGVQYGDRIYFGTSFHFNAGLRRYQIRTSTDGGETIPDDQILYDVAATTDNSRPCQAAATTNAAVVLFHNLKVGTSANNFASLIPTGLSGSISESAKGRHIVAVGSLLYVAVGDQCVVSTDGGLTWGDPITLPISSVTSISVNKP